MKQRKDGRYQSKVYIGTVKGEKQYQYVYGDTQKEVKTKVNRLKHSLDIGQNITSGKRKTLSYWIDAWLDNNKDDMTNDWYTTEKARLSVFDEEIGDMDITEINTQDLQMVIKKVEKSNPRTGKPTSKKTLIEYRNVISRVFAYAVQNRVLTFDASSYITISKTATKSIRTALNDSDINKIVNTEDVMKLPTMLMMYAGLRRGEVCALTRKDIDLDNRVIHITKSYDFKEQKIKTPKTDSGVRDVPIIDVLHNYLSAYMSSHKMDSIYIVNDNGKPYTNGRWLREWERYTDKIDIQTTAHCLRHTFVTLLYEAGVDEFTTKEIVGHSDISTTRGIYTHLRDNKRKNSLEKLNQYLAK